MPAAEHDVTGPSSQQSGFPTLGSHRWTAPFSVAREITAGALLLRESHAPSAETKGPAKEQGFLVIVFFMVLFTDPVTT